QIPLAQYQSMTVQFISLVIVMHELKRYGMTAEGVDNHFYLRAKADGKVTSQLESVDDQIRYLATMAQGNEDNLIRQTIDDAQQLEQMMTQMRQSWRSGDLTTLTATGITPMQRDYPRIYQSLLVERNNNWMPRIKKLLQHPEPKLILVGALHLAGPDGLLAMLADDGYQLEQLRIQPAAVP
ncbi:MAG: TraB/GumN family protein, partial [Pseudomonadota bacterium]